MQSDLRMLSRDYVVCNDLFIGIKAIKLKLPKAHHTTITIA